MLQFTYSAFKMKFMKYMTDSLPFLNLSGNIIPKLALYSTLLVPITEGLQQRDSAKSIKLSWGDKPLLPFSAGLRGPVWRTNRHHKEASWYSARWVDECVDKKCQVGAGLKPRTFVQQDTGKATSSP